MRALLLALCLLAGCASSGVYRVQFDSKPGAYTAYALSPTTLLALSHEPVEKGDLGWVKTLRGDVRFAVIATYGPEVFLAGTATELVPGDSGAALIRDDGVIVGLVWARPWRQN